MAISIGGVILPDGLGDQGEPLWPAERAYSPVQQSTRQTLAGRLHYRANPLDCGSLIELQF